MLSGTIALTNYGKTFIQHFDKNLYFETQLSKVG